MTGWTLVAAEGRDAVRFLHSQLTSDVERLVPGSSQQTALLDRGGRLQAFGFVCRKPDRIELLLPTEVAAPTVQRLGKHIIADDVAYNHHDLHDGLRAGLFTEADLMETVFPHPTLSEMMHESVLDAYGRVIHI